MAYVAKQHALYLNGLEQAGVSDHTDVVSRHVNSPNLDITHLPIDWRSGAAFFDLFEMTKARTEQLLRMYGRAALVGASGGGGLALNVFQELRSRDQELKLSLICLNARLRVGNLMTLGAEATDFADKGMVPAYIDSVLRCESEAVPNLTEADRRLMRTVTPLADKVVPTDAMRIPGVANLVVPVSGHFRGIAKGLLIIPEILDDIGVESPPVDN
jgi:hypothetical protein